MTLHTLSLQNFRNHDKASFEFDTISIIVGSNAAGKTNILEAIHYLSHGKSFRAEKEQDVIMDGKDFARIEGTIVSVSESVKLSVLLINKLNFFQKKYLVNDVARRQIDFISHFLTVLFTPSDIEMLTDSPSLRRAYVDSILLQIDREYRRALSLYEKSLRQRNRILSDIKDGKRRYRKEEFEYWDNLLIEQGGIITNKRKALVEFINESKKTTFDFNIMYDKSTITAQRLEHYQQAEQAAGVTLVGPQRDEFVFVFPNSVSNTSDGGEAATSTSPRWTKTIKEFGSRGEQRLTILQLKLLEIEFIKQSTGETPVLLLDDIFSELDDQNIKRILELLPHQQTILTTTHKEFIPQHIMRNARIVRL